MDPILRFSSRDVNSVEQTWQQFVPSAALQGFDPERFRFDWSSARLPGLSVVHYELAARIRCDVAPEDQLLVCRVDGADARVSTARGDLDPRRPWLTDGHQVQASWEDEARVRALIFDRRAAQNLARQITGNDRLRLRVAEASPDGDTSHWERTFEYIAASAEALKPSDELLISSLRRHALWVTLSTFPTTFREAMSRPAQMRSAPATVRRAVDFIEENAHRDITIDDVARAVHMSTRGLQYAFRRALDTTPAEHLRRVRLEGAHRELKSQTGETIAAIARRWGFAHPSRFASAYREVYGVLPAVTAGRRHS